MSGKLTKRGSEAGAQTPPLLRASSPLKPKNQPRTNIETGIANGGTSKAILDFLNYDESHRKTQLKSTAMSPAPGAVSSGRQFYIAQSCDTCHSIAGKGGDIGPALNGVGAKLSRAQIIQIVRDGKANTTMPALPSGTADQQLNELVDFLASLK